ncbi:MAG: DUF2974 domain-containing protein [Bacilli bacterium]|nr:DUF2974 domain-containing protein [Bacilli bacterium]
MDVFDYLNNYKNVTFKEMPFNEVDALVLALISYVPIDELGITDKKIKAPLLLERIKKYMPPFGTSERKLKYMKLASLVCDSKRFDDVYFAHFVKERDFLTDKQFQAITIVLDNFLYISFCGTDSTVLGWKEDFNMAVLETVPSEVSAVKYVDEILSKFWFKKVYLGGHSKGGRLAISAAKGMSNKRRLAAIFAFDAPNFPANCYNEDYKKIDSYLLSYAPNESIIGRLMNEYHQKRIIHSTNSFLMQHDAFSWVVDGKSFVYDSDYTEKSTKVSNSINNILLTYDEETKHQFIDTLFDLLERLDIEELPNEKDFIPYFIKRAPSLLGEWKATPKENRQVIKKVVIDILKDYFLNK